MSRHIEKQGEPQERATDESGAVSVAASTHQGARPYQEDRFGTWTGSGGAVFSVVIDGAGGHGGGAEAAQAALDEAERFWGEEGGQVSDGEEFLERWMLSAHDAVNREAARIARPARAVVVAMLARDGRVWWVHAGDSRLYRIRNGEIVQRTRDDSIVQVLFERGEITEEEMGSHPDQSRLLQSLGGEDPPRPRHGSAEIESGDAFLLCSDGLWEHLSREEIEALAATPPAGRQAALDDAVATAVRRAGKKADNTTVVLLVFGDPPGAAVATSPASSSWPLYLMIFAVFCLIVGGTGWWMTRDHGKAAPRTTVVPDNPAPGPGDGEAGKPGGGKAAPNGAEPAKPEPSTPDGKSMPDSVEPGSSPPDGKSGPDAVAPEEQSASPSKIKSGSTSEGAKGKDEKRGGKQNTQTSEDPLGEPDGTETSKPKTGTGSETAQPTPPSKTKNAEQPTEEAANPESTPENSNPSEP